MHLCISLHSLHPTRLNLTVLVTGGCPILCTSPLPCHQSCSPNYDSSSPKTGKKPPHLFPNSSSHSPCCKQRTLVTMPIIYASKTFKPSHCFENKDHRLRLGLRALCVTWQLLSHTVTAFRLILSAQAATGKSRSWEA